MIWSARSVLYTILYHHIYTISSSTMIWSAKSMLYHIYYIILNYDMISQVSTIYNTISSILYHPQAWYDQPAQYYRVFLKKVPTFVLFISRLLKHLKKWFCTFFNSPVFAESKNNHISILRLKLEKLLQKVLWEYYIWNNEYWAFNQFDDKLIFLHFFGFQDTLKRGFILFSTAQGVQNPKMIKFVFWN